MRVATRLRFAVPPLRWMYLMSDPTLPALPVSNVSFHAGRLPADGSLWSRCDCLFLRFGFKHRQGFRGLHTDLLLYLFLSSSSSHSLPLCSPFQVFPGVSESLSSLLFLSSRGRWEQTAWQISLFFFSPPLHFLVFRVWLLSPYFPVAPLLLFSKLSWEKALIDHFEGVKSALVRFFLSFFFFSTSKHGAL